MKKRIIVLCVAIAILCFSFWIGDRKNAQYQKRYHEHLEEQISYKDYDYSGIDANTYMSRTIDESNFSSHLPVLSFDTRGQEILGANDKSVKEYIQVSLSIFDKEENRLTDYATYDTEALLRYRGNSSRFFDKGSMRLKLINKKGEDKDYPLLGLSTSSDFVLHGPWLDKTLMRNYIGYNLTGELMDYSPNVRYCEVFVNGEYRGVYLLVETIKVDKNKVNISKLNKNSDVTSYLLMMTARHAEDDDLYYLNNFTKYTQRIHEFSSYNIKYPTNSKMTLELNKYINDDLSEFERMLYSYDYDDDNLGYVKYLDIDSFVNYVVLNEFFINYDAGSNSTYVYKDKTGKFKLVFWDLNNIFDNYFQNMLESQDFLMKDRSWFQMLFKDEYFTERVITRYKELRQSILSEDYLYDYIDGVIDYLGPAIERNFVRWGDTFTSAKNKYFDESRNPQSYLEAIEDMKYAIHVHGLWLDENIDSLRQFSHESKVKKYNP